MNKTHQFWTLLKFQIHANPGIFSLPLLFIIIVFSTHMAGIQGDFEHSLSLQVGQTMWLVMAFTFIPQILAPELSLIRSGTVSRELGTEFFLTLATDSYLILRIRSVLCYALILITPLCLLFCSLTSPRLDLKESDTKIYHMLLQQVPGSTQVQSMSGVDVAGNSITPSDRSELVSIPYGKPMITSWRILLLTSTIACAQIFIFVICQLRFQKMLYYGVGFGLLFLPIPLMIFTDKMNFDFHSTSWNEIAFIFFASHQLLCWLIAIAIWILGQLWSENRFSRMEQ